jgi:hypothetical protein
MQKSYCSEYAQRSTKMPRYKFSGSTYEDNVKYLDHVYKFSEPQSWHSKKQILAGEKNKNRQLHPTEDYTTDTRAKIIVLLQPGKFAEIIRGPSDHG